MATLTIRNLPEGVREKLRLRAASNGRSTEAEVRAMLAEAVGDGSRPARPSVEERLARAQAAFAPFRAVGGSVADELIAERRIEGWKENLESLQEMNAGKPLHLQPYLK
jgi:plasmid stability protein